MSGIPNLKFQAMMEEMQKLIKAEFEGVHERLNRVQEEAQQRKPRNLPSRRERIQPRCAKTDYNRPEVDSYSHGVYPTMESRRRSQYAREGRDRSDDNLGGLKLKIPTFHGKNDPDAYLEWEKNMELVFECQKYSEFKKVRVAAYEFCDYAIIWWDQLVKSRRRNGEYPIETWSEMKAVMRRRFVPSHYHGKLHQKLRRLDQSNRSVDDYFQEMLPKSILVEQQKKGNRRQTSGSNSSHMNPSSSKEVKTVPKPSIDTKPSTATKEIQGHCGGESPNQKAMGLRVNGELETEKEGESYFTDPDDKDGEELATKEELVVVKRSQNEQAQMEEMVQQKELFHSRCNTPDKLCSMIAAKRSCTNAASTILEEKLGSKGELGEFTKSVAVLPCEQQRGVIYSILIKEKPPESIQHVPAQHCTVSRSKLFQEEGYDVIMEPVEAVIKPEAEPELDQSGGTSLIRLGKDIHAFNGAYQANQKDSGNKSTYSINLTHQRFMTKWNQVHRSSDLLGIEFTKPVIPDDHVSKAEADLRPLFDSFQSNHDDSDHETTWETFSAHPERFSKWNHSNQSSDDGVIQFSSQMIPDYPAIEAESERCSLFGSFRLNDKVLRSETNWNTFLAQPCHVSKWKQLNWSIDGEVIQIANRVSPNLPDLDICSFLGGFWHNQEELSNKPRWYRESTHQRKSENWIREQIQFGLRVIDFTNWVNRRIPDLDPDVLIEGFRAILKELSYKPACYGIVTQSGRSSNWIHPNTGFGLEVIQLLNQVMLNLPCLKSHGIDQLQTYLWRPGEFKYHSEAVQKRRMFLMDCFKRIWGRRIFRSPLEMIPIKSSPFGTCYIPKKAQIERCIVLPKRSDENEDQESLLEFKDQEEVKSYSTHFYCFQ